MGPHVFIALTGYAIDYRTVGALCVVPSGSNQKAALRASIFMCAAVTSGKMVIGPAGAAEWRDDRSAIGSGTRGDGCRR
jgi:hypothetical protein